MQGSNRAPAAAARDSINMKWKLSRNVCSGATICVYVASKLTLSAFVEYLMTFGETPCGSRVHYLTGSAVHVAWRGKCAMYSKMIM